MYLKLAWRNIWRNRRRTLITLASVFFAVILSTLMMSIKEGVYEGMIDSMVGDFTGYAQVHSKGYWDDQTINNSMAIESSLKNTLISDERIAGYAPRIESYALSAFKDVTKGTRVIGIDPEKEKKHIQLDERISEGSYLQSEDRAVLLGIGLAEQLGVVVNDTIVLLGQGYHGVSAAGKYPVKGILKFGSPELSKRIVFLPANEAQILYGADDLYTNIVLHPETPRNTKELVRDLESAVDTSAYEIMTWQELAPDLVNIIKTDRMEGYVFMFILYMVISFGVFGTILMMLAERKHEFGVLVAVGMKRFQLSVIVFFELLFLAILGSIAGMIGALPVCLYFNINPITFGSEMSEMVEEYGMEPVIRASLDPAIFIQQGTIVAAIATVIAIYPFVKLMRLNAVKAMHS